MRNTFIGHIANWQPPPQKYKNRDSETKAHEVLVDWIKENENLKKELAEVRVEKNTIQDKLAAEERELAWHTRHKDAQNELVSVKKDTERYGFVCFSNLSESIFCLFPWDPMPVSMDPMETGKNIH
jgi:hypothetical protein